MQRKAAEPQGGVDASGVAGGPKWRRGAGSSAGRRVEAAATFRRGESVGNGGLRFKRKQRCLGRRGSPHRRRSGSPAGSGGPVQTGSGRWCRPTKLLLQVGGPAVASGAERSGADLGPPPGPSHACTPSRPPDQPRHEASPLTRRERRVWGVGRFGLRGSTDGEPVARSSGGTYV